MTTSFSFTPASVVAGAVWKIETTLGRWVIEPIHWNLVASNLTLRRIGARTEGASTSATVVPSLGAAL